MDKPPEIKVRFVISDFSCTPEKITELLNINPTETWRTGDPIVRPGFRKHKQNGWMLALEPSTTEWETSKLVDRLLRKLEPSFEAIRKLPPEVGWNCL